MIDVGFHSNFGYGMDVRAEPNGNDFISVFAFKAREFDKFCKLLNPWQFLTPN